MQAHDFRAYAPAGVTPDVVRLLLAMQIDQRQATYARLTGDDVDGCPVRCGAPGCLAEIPLCQAHVARVKVEHNYTAGIEPIIDCSHELAFSGQHCGCSLAHLRAAVIECWDNHLTPRIQANVDALARWRAANAPRSPTEEARP